MCSYVEDEILEVEWSQGYIYNFEAHWIMATWHCYLQQLQDSAKKRHYCIVTNTSLGKFLADVMEGNKDNLLQFLVKKIYFFERVA